MDSVVSIFQSIFSFMLNNSVFGLPILIWFVGFATLGLLISFLKGSKK